ncbi:MAG: DUF1294 domain-containing protein [Devosia sp.]
MKEAGELVEWNDERGFGFVRSATGERLFVHISAFDHPMRRPEIGDRLTYIAGPGKDGRPALASAQIAGLRHSQPPPPKGPSPDRIEGAQLARALRLLAAALLLGALIVLHQPRFLLWIYVGMGCVSFLAYGLDKLAARAGRWRTAETTLHAIDLAGGIIGGLLAQAGLHHKTAKPAFTVATFGIVLVHLIALLALAFAPGNLLAGWR